MITVWHSRWRTGIAGGQPRRPEAGWASLISSTRRITENYFRLKSMQSNRSCDEGVQRYDDSRKDRETRNKEI